MFFNKQLCKIFFLPLPIFKLASVHKGWEYLFKLASLLHTAKKPPFYQIICYHIRTFISFINCHEISTFSFCFSSIKNHASKSTCKY